MYSTSMGFDVKNFEEEVINRSHQVPVLVDFWADWCGPCKMLSPILERLASASNGAWVLAKIDTEEFPDLAIGYGVQGIPAVKLFHRGEVTAEFVGALPEYAVTQWLQKNVPSVHQSTLELAEELVAEGRAEEAADQLHEILAAEPDNQHAKAALARIVLFADPAASARLVADVDDPAEMEITDGIRTVLRLFDIAARPEELPPGAVRSLYLAAIGHLRAQRFEDALEAFIGVIRQDRYYDDDGSRKACIAIFKVLGEDHPVTQKYRREFSRALYV